jgi:hypothetical protein
MQKQLQQTIAEYQLAQKDLGVSIYSKLSITANYQKKPTSADGKSSHKFLKTTW